MCQPSDAPEAKVRHSLFCTFDRQSAPQHFAPQDGHDLYVEQLGGGKLSFREQPAHLFAKGRL
jgi:hypothetical protein